MKTLLRATCATLTLALAAIPATAPAGAGFTLPAHNAQPLIAKVGCWDECEDYYEAIEEAREEAAEEAAAYAEEAMEEGYSPRRKTRRARRAPREDAAPRLRAVSTRPQGSPEPAPTEEGEKKAEPASSAGKRAVAVNADGHCKQYFPAVGMTLSVPCE